MIPFRLEYTIDRTLHPHLLDVKRALNKLGRVRLSTREAHEVLPWIQNHKWYISERLGRDVGMRVAVVDYFDNIYEPASSSTISGKSAGRIRRVAQRLVGTYLHRENGGKLIA